jgi:hypothetical protein
LGTKLFSSDEYQSNKFTDFSGLPKYSFFSVWAAIFNHDRAFGIAVKAVDHLSQVRFFASYNSKTRELSKRVAAGVKSFLPCKIPNHDRSCSFCILRVRHCYGCRQAHDIA